MEEPPRQRSAQGEGQVEDVFEACGEAGEAEDPDKGGSRKKEEIVERRRYSMGFPINPKQKGTWGATGNRIGEKLYEG